MRTRAALVALVCLLALGVVGTVAHGTTAPRLTIVVLSGQSNAIGFQSYVVDPKTHDDVFTGSGSSRADHRVLLMWTESQVPTSGATPVALDTPQVLPGAPSAIFGPEVALGRGLYAAGHHNLLIVKVAFSGTSLAANWQPTTADFKALLARVAQAKAWARAHGFHPVLAAFYWMQGETDAMSAASASAYAGNLKTFLAEIRADLPLPATAPIVIGQIDLVDYIRFLKNDHQCTTPSCSGETLWNKEVMQAQAKAAGKDVFVAPTATFPRYEDYLHLSDLGELDLGKQFASLSEKHLG